MDLYGHLFTAASVAAMQRLGTEVARRTARSSNRGRRARERMKTRWERFGLTGWAFGAFTLLCVAFYLLVLAFGGEEFLRGCASPIRARLRLTPC
jgi:hypothetical protein